jgi:cell division septum initiation protein DivIVA
MADLREKFATQVDPTLLASVRGLARQEGRQLQALVEEALSDLLEKRQRTRARAHVMAAYQGSHENYAELYEILAK